MQREPIAVRLDACRLAAPDRGWHGRDTNSPRPLAALILHHDLTDSFDLPSRPEPMAMAHRVVTDALMNEWSVWDVRPTGRAGPVRTSYEQGWLAFECGLKHRRLAPIPATWPKCTDSEVLEWLAQAAPIETTALSYRPVNAERTDAPRARD